MTDKELELLAAKHFAEFIRHRKAGRDDEASDMRQTFHGVVAQISDSETKDRLRQELEQGSMTITQKNSEDLLRIAREIAQIGQSFHDGAENIAQSPETFVTTTSDFLDKASDALSEFRDIGEKVSANLSTLDDNLQNNNFVQALNDIEALSIEITDTKNRIRGLL